jgi:type IV secretory pathway VirB9-like protein
MTRISKIFVLGCTVLTSPAHAWQTPTQVSAASPVCTIPYNPNDGTTVYASPGDTLTIELGDTRTIKDVAVSDSKHLKSMVTGNVLWLKPVSDMTAQPISLRAVRDDGKAELYILQWEAGGSAATPSKCDLVRFTYPQDAIEARKAALAKRKAEAESRAMSRQLHEASRLPTAGSTTNRSYTISGDAGLMPTQLSQVTPSNALTQVAPLVPRAGAR